MAISAQDKLPLPVELSSVTPDQDSASAQVDGLAFARLYGKPLFKPPQNLYILPDALEVFLEAFEGLLDLLLYLIRRQNFSALDIPLAQATRQYLVYIEQIHAINLELAVEHLPMAAMFIEIRSRTLLPVKKTGSGNGPEDPRAELMRHLFEYERARLVAQKLDTVPQLDRDFPRIQVYIEQSLASRCSDVNSGDLRVAWADVLRRAKLTQHHKISREELSVREYMSQILRRLQYVWFMESIGLFEEAIRSGKGAPIVVVNFVATLEFSCELLPEIMQAESYALICVHLTCPPT